MSVLDSTQNYLMCMRTLNDLKWYMKLKAVHYRTKQIDILLFTNLNVMVVSVLAHV